MDEERYAGERRGLGLFLEELRPIVARELDAEPHGDRVAHLLEAVGLRAYRSLG